MAAPVVTELASHQCGQGSIPAEYHMWVEFVVASGLAPRVFPLVLRFFSLQKNQHFQIAVPSGQGTLTKTNYNLLELVLFISL